MSGWVAGWDSAGLVVAASRVVERRRRVRREVRFFMGEFSCKKLVERTGGLG